MKSLLSEVCVEGETDVDSESCHDLKADTVNEAQSTPTGAENGGHAGLVLFLTDPTDVEDRHDFALEDLQGFLAKPILDQGCDLYQNITDGFTPRSVTVHGAEKTMTTKHMKYTKKDTKAAQRVVGLCFSLLAFISISGFCPSVWPLTARCRERLPSVFIP